MTATSPNASSTINQFTRSSHIRTYSTSSQRSTTVNNKNNTGNNTGNSTGGSGNGNGYGNRTYATVGLAGTITLCIAGLVMLTFNDQGVLIQVAHCDDGTNNDDDGATTSSIDNPIFLLDEETDEEWSRQLTSHQLFWKLIGRDVWLMAFGIVTALVSAYLGIQIPKVFGKLIDSAKKGESLRDPAVHAVLILLAQAGLNFVYTTLISIACERYSNNLRNTLFQSLLDQEVAFFDFHSTGDLINRLTNDVQLVRSALKHSVSLGVRSIAQIVGGVVSLFLISSKLSVAMITILPTMVGIGTLYAGWLKRLSIRSQEAMAQSTSVAEEAIGNLRTVVAFANEDLEARRFAAKSKESLDLATETGIQIGIFQGVTSMALNAVSLLVYWYGGNLVASGEITSGQLTSFIIHTMSMQASFSQLSVLFTQISNASGGMERITEMINRQSTIPRQRGKRLANIKGRIEFDSVGFRYPARKNIQVLKEFNLTLQPGQVIALAGPSGGGKSTIAALLERFYDANEGTITIDGVPIQELSASWLRKQIGIVNQEPALFATTILENLSYGNPNATRDQIEEAARQANAHQFIISFPMGYDTIVGERGVQLSGGQKQRIAIARAILKNPKILILDEATSALDSESEGLVQDALQVLMKGRTTLVIAHRLSTVQNADSIAVVSNGRVSEFGPHAVLMAKPNGLYHQLVQRQVQQQTTTS
ncbi:hypothetical protein SAMD00019534_008350 [Acytostelium subglobosum LB1]|uniref:hypothetical protein n=1 Tax=Acytostelium subglobosum LB1 TaxID=1410327 RepID=UPI000644E116|nr:hypothetical protein SAMD00019534_008350 [Acytostelium subglobosum LB1]GAM17660.1 hypothetical protein SAMD00019534_008350 [Acytostelium subglobosum LB1]|eukprot:XP_012758256.1 hypothetical protein SAMD00019534_008350 [Acytostelium subglobosum LB1]